jgi:hypothetical protein
MAVGIFMRITLRRLGKRIFLLADMNTYTSLQEGLVHVIFVRCRLRHILIHAII